MVNSRSALISIMFLAVLAFAPAAHADDAGSNPAATADALKQICIDACSRNVMLCASDEGAREACADVSECAILTDSDAERLKAYCAECVGVGDCSKPTLKPPKPKKPRASADDLCKARGGAMITVRRKTSGDDGATETRQCLSKEGVVAKLQALILDEGVTPPVKEQKPQPETIPVRTESLVEIRPESSPAQENKATVPPSPPVPAFLVAPSPRDEEDPKRVASLERRFDRLLSIQLAASSSVHALSELNEKAVWAVGPEVMWLPGIHDNLRLFVGVGVGYAGESVNFAQMRGLWIPFGFQWDAKEFVRLGFGCQVEQRVDREDVARIKGWYGFFEPKFTLGNKPGNPPAKNHFVISARLGLGASTVQSPFTGQLYTYFDALAGLQVGYAFLPP